MLFHLILRGRIFSGHQGGSPGYLGLAESPPVIEELSPGLCGGRPPGSLLPRTAASTGSRVIEGGFSLSLWVEEPAHRLRCCLPGAGRCAAILSVESQLGLSAGVW